MSATGWGSGYVTDRDYTMSFYREQSPGHLNTACVLRGAEPVLLDRPFTYLELGAGHGLTTTLLAAAHPQGRFYANDFMPSHVAGAQQLADAAGLDNLQMLENSFAELAQGKVDLPQFDFITMHGVYSWVSIENRRHIVAILARYLKPGGIVYVSYNALPGWAPALPLKRLLYEGAGGDSTQRIVRGRAFVERLIDEAQAKYFQATPSLEHELGHLRGSDPAYLVHEYLHSGWSPLYHADVAADLAAAKLEFVALANLCGNGFTFTAEQQALLDEVPDPTWRETVRDFMINTRFRKDVYVRGRRALPPGALPEWMDSALLTLIVPRDKAHFGFEWGTEPEQSAAQALLDRLARTPLSLSEVARSLGFASLPDLALQVVMLMGETASAAIVVPADAGGKVDTAPALRLNRAIALQSRQADRIPALVSPLTGNGFHADLVERLVYAELAERPGDTEPLSVTARVRAVLKGLQDTPAAQADGSDPAALVSRVSHVLAHSVPLWRSLKAI